MSTASSAVGIRPGSLRAWVLAARPATLAVAVVPVLVGTAIAHAMHHARIGPALAALLGAMWIQIGTNFANDVFDYEKGADTEERLGPVRATQAGLLDARAMRIGMIASFALATFAGTYLLAVAGWPVFVIGIVSIASGIAYTGGPYPLGYNGLGDLFVFVFFGFVAVCGTVFVQTASVPWMAIAASIPVGALATAILVVNNVRDGATDVKAGKRTVVVRFGRAFGVAEYVVLLVLAYAVPIACAVMRRSPWLLLALVTVPIAVSLARTIRRETAGPVLNAALARTAKLLLAHGALFAAGIALS